MTAYTPVKALPLNVRVQEAQRLISGQTTQLRRYNDKLFSRAQIGGYFWLREPHRFFAKHDAISPTVIAQQYDGRPSIHFEADSRSPESYGKLRHARATLRILSRATLKIIAIREGRLQSWSVTDRQALGLSKVQYAKAWDRNRRQLKTFGNIEQANWDDDPTVTIITVELTMINIEQLLAAKQIREPA